MVDCFCCRLLQVNDGQLLVHIGTNIRKLIKKVARLFRLMGLVSSFWQALRSGLIVIIIIFFMIHLFTVRVAIKQNAFLILHLSLAVVVVVFHGVKVTSHQYSWHLLLNRLLVKVDIRTLTVKRADE